MLFVCVAACDRNSGVRSVGRTEEGGRREEERVSTRAILGYVRPLYVHLIDYHSGMQLLANVHCARGVNNFGVSNVSTSTNLQGILYVQTLARAGGGTRKEREEDQGWPISVAES